DRHRSALPVIPRGVAVQVFPGIPEIPERIVGRRVLSYASHDLPRHESATHIACAKQIAALTEAYSPAATMQRRFDLSFCFFAARAGGVRSFFFTVLTPGRRAVALADRVPVEAFDPLRAF